MRPHKCAYIIDSEQTCAYITGSEKEDEGKILDNIDDYNISAVIEIKRNQIGTFFEISVQHHIRDKTGLFGTAIK